MFLRPLAGTVRRMDVGAMLARIGRRVAELRAERGMTQEDLAAALDMETRDLQRIEQGAVNFTMRRLANLATALRCEPSELLVLPTSGDAVSASSVGRRAPSRPRRA